MTITISNIKSFPYLPPFINCNEWDHLKLWCRPLSDFMELFQIHIAVNILYHPTLKACAQNYTYKNTFEYLLEFIIAVFHSYKHELCVSLCITHWFNQSPKLQTFQLLFFVISILYVWISEFYKCIFGLLS